MNWFDILYGAVALVALFMAGYNIGWNRGFDHCKKSLNDLFQEAIKAAKAKAEDESIITLRKNLNDCKAMNLWYAEQIESLRKERDYLRRGGDKDEQS